MFMPTSPRVWTPIHVGIGVEVRQRVNEGASCIVSLLSNFFAKSVQGDREEKLNDKHARDELGSVAPQHEDSDLTHQKDDMTRLPGVSSCSVANFAIVSNLIAVEF